MSLFGFSINALSLFGLVLAIGIVVDDAIVVVENVERNIENGLSPRDATYRAMREVSGPIIAIALVLCAVFVPLSFVPGLTGQFYKQFAVTIAISTVISAFNSLTLSPALAALLLRSHDAPKDWLTRAMDMKRWRRPRKSSASSPAKGKTIRMTSDLALTTTARSNTGVYAARVVCVACRWRSSSTCASSFQSCTCRCESRFEPRTLRWVSDCTVKNSTLARRKIANGVA